MNQTVKKIVDILFQDTVENEETQALHEEVMNNCQEHYQDLISRGLTEDEAVAEVVESLKGMKDVIAQYPKKTAAPAADTKEEGKDWTFYDADCLTVETSDQDLYISPSPDGAVHIYCDDPEGLTAEQDGGKVRIKGAQKRDRAASAFEMQEGEEISLTGILNMVGKAIRNVASTFMNGAPIRIEVPDGQMKEVRLESRSGDIECSCAMARTMTVRTTSGSIRMDPVTEKTAEKLLASTISGDAEIHGSAMEAEISSMSGDVTVDGVFETLKLQNTSGDIEFTGTAVKLTAHTVSGDLDASLENQSLKQIEAESISGDVDIQLPSGLSSVHAVCSTVSGDCLSRVSDAGTEAVVQIRAKSVSGDVTVQ